MDERLKEIFELCKLAGAWPIRWPEVAIEAPESCRFTAHKLALLKEDFDSGDSLALAEVVQLTWEEEFRLPHWAHYRLAVAFANFLQGAGDKSLEGLLKLQPGKGRGNNPFKRRERKGLNLETVFHVCLLNRYFKFSLPVTYLILSKIKIEYWDGQQKISSILSSSRIEDIYKESERKYSIKELEDIGYAQEDRLDLFIKEYGEVFTTLCENGALHEQGLLPSAMRSFNKLLPSATLAV